MVRRYAPKRRPWADKDKRMSRAVQLRNQGLSLRAIAADLAVDERTVRRDLDRWADISQNVTALVRQSGAAKCPARGEMPHPNAAHGATVTPLRRSS
jgi:IS30 family transposase